MKNGTTTKWKNEPDAIFQGGRWLSFRRRRKAISDANSKEQENRTRPFAWRSRNISNERCRRNSDYSDAKSVADVNKIRTRA